MFITYKPVFRFLVIVVAAILFPRHVALSAKEMAVPPLLFSEGRRLELPVFSKFGCFPTNLVAADLNADGHTDLAVSGFCNRFAVFYADPENTPKFHPPREIEVPTSAIGMAVLPAKGKEHPLLVVSNCANPDTINRQPLLHAVSMKSLEVIETFPSGGKAPDDIAVGDFNGDGMDDLIVGHWKDGVLSVLLGEKGLGKFRVPADSSPQRLVFGDEHWQLLARDFNRDGKVDVATVVWTFGAGNAKKAELQILFGDGQGGFSLSSKKAFSVDPEARSLASADFDGNGTLDIAVANPGSGLKEDGGIALFFGDGKGNFFPTRSLDASGKSGGNEIIGGLLAPQGISAADFDGDGAPDLAVASRPVSQPGRMTILYNTGKGYFSSARRQNLMLGGKHKVSPLSFQPLITSDMDGDGRVDIVMANNDANTITVFYNNTPTVSTE